MRCWFLPPLQWLASLIARLPQPALLALGRALAWLGWPLLRSRRRIARINVDLCFPDLDVAARRALVHDSLVNTVIGALELMRAWHAPSSALAGLTQVEGLEHLRAALARGQGVLLMCGHFTHTELAVRLLGEALGQPVRVVVRRHNNACLEAWFERARGAVYGATIGKKDVRALLRNLMDGQPVVYSADQNFTYQNAFVPFFGVPAATITGLSRIAKLAGAAVVPVVTRQLPGGQGYVLRFYPAWADFPTEDVEADVRRMNAFIEERVLEMPEQYHWLHKRFKTRPPGVERIY